MSNGRFQGCIKQKVGWSNRRRQQEQHFASVNALLRQRWWSTVTVKIVIKQKSKGKTTSSPTQHSGRIKSAQIFHFQYSTSIINRQPCWYRKQKNLTENNVEQRLHCIQKKKSRISTMQTSEMTGESSNQCQLGDYQEQLNQQTR